MLLHKNLLFASRKRILQIATDPKMVELLLLLEKFNKNIWEPACGQGHISKILELNGHKVYSTDLIDRGYGTGGIDFFFAKLLSLDFINDDGFFDGDIITNPLYKFEREFVSTAIDIVTVESKVAMFLPLRFLESKERGNYIFNRYIPKVIYISRSRVICAKNGDFVSSVNDTAIPYIWIIWQKGFKGDTILKWFN